MNFNVFGLLSFVVLTIVSPNEAYNVDEELAEPQWYMSVGFAVQHQSSPYTTTAKNTPPGVKITLEHVPTGRNISTACLIVNAFSGCSSLIGDNINDNPNGAKSAGSAAFSEIAKLYYGPTYSKAGCLDKMPKHSCEFKVESIFGSFVIVRLEFIIYPVVNEVLMCHSANNTIQYFASHFLLVKTNT